MYGLFAKGENGQGIAMNMIISAIENHKRIVLNFSKSMAFRFAFAEPIVISTIATTIRAKWKSPKKVKSQFEMEVLKLAK